MIALRPWNQHVWDPRPLPHETEAETKINYCETKTETLTRPRRWSRGLNIPDNVHNVSRYHGIGTGVEQLLINTNSTPLSRTVSRPELQIIVVIILFTIDIQLCIDNISATSIIFQDISGFVLAALRHNKQRLETKESVGFFADATQRLRDKKRKKVALLTVHT